MRYFAQFLASSKIAANFEMVEIVVCRSLLLDVDG
jgi:hypothetical protein